jgi:integrase/recombinase XerC
MTVREACAEFIIYLKDSRRMSEHTVAAYNNDYRTFASLLGAKADMPPDVVSSDDLRACIAQLSREKREASSINRFIAAVRSLFAYCRRLGYIPCNPAESIKTIKQPKRLPLFMTRTEVSELCKEPERTGLLWESRDRALFEMLYSSGCRVSEASGLKLGDFSHDFSTALVHGKGNKDRMVFFADDAVHALKDYLLERKARLSRAEDSKTDAVFLNDHGKPLTVRGIRYILDRYSGLEGTNRHVNPHAFRHTFATQLISNGADVRVVQEMLGHSSISTTQRYTHVTTEQLIRTYNKAHPHGDGARKVL